MDQNCSSSGNSTSFLCLLNGPATLGQDKSRTNVKAFVLSVAVSLGFFAFNLSGFFLLKSSAMGRRI